MALDKKKKKRVADAVRETLGKELRKRYEKGASIRSLAQHVGRSYGYVHDLLIDAGTTLRPKGGNTHPKYDGTTQSDRDKVGPHLKRMYEDEGLSTAALARKIGKPVHFVRVALEEAGTTMRPFRPTSSESH